MRGWPVKAVTLIDVHLRKAHHGLSNKNVHFTWPTSHVLLNLGGYMLPHTKHNASAYAFLPYRNSGFYMGIPSPSRSFASKSLPAQSLGVHRFFAMRTHCNASAENLLCLCPSFATKSSRNFSQSATSSVCLVAWLHSNPTATFFL